LHSYHSWRVRRPFVAFAVIAAVLIAALGLTYYSYRNTPSERLVILDTMRELAEEKVVGIQTEIYKAETDIFNRVNPENLADLKRALEGSTLRSVLVLDDEKEKVILLTKRRGEDTDRFFLEVVVPDLALGRVLLDQRRSLHASYNGVPHLFAYTSKLINGKLYFIVVESDINHLRAVVFPEFFDVSGRHLYQVVDRAGGSVYGYRFSGVAQSDIVELPFHDTLSQWRLRVAPKDAKLLASRASRRATLDVVLIAVALAVILSGFFVMLWNVRRERRLSELKSEFISNVSHELKTPLSLISMFGELLSMGRTRSPEQATEYAEIIRRESVRLSRLIDSVLDFSKIERGVDVYEFADDQNLGEIVRRALDISRHRLERTEMELDAELADDLPPVRIDANAITVAVLNLVDNAIKYAADGKRLGIALRPADDGVELEVRDFGPGVPEDEREAIFDRFYRSRTVRLKPIRGSGIGLALVKHIAEAHGGEVSVRSGDDGRGAVFRLWIPTHRES
jgi:two-component system, OmpR family, phosphate regulon sensor histidine kinase PhoR